MIRPKNVLLIFSDQVVIMKQFKCRLLLPLLGITILAAGCGSEPGPVAEEQVTVPSDVPDILENYQGSSHADSVAGSTALCSRCHSDEGFRVFIGETAGLDADELAVALSGSTPPASMSTIHCSTCHGGSSGGLRASETTASEDGTPVTKFSTQFNLCTSCHQVFLHTDFDAGSGTYRYLLNAEKRPMHGSVDGAGTPAPGGRVIWDTHFAYPAGNIAGYNINAADDKACTLCHDPHAATKFRQVGAVAIAGQWGISGHADYHGAPFTANITQPACFKCHSGTGFADYLQGVSPAALDPSEGPRVIACIACHDLQARDAAGDFAPGALRQVEAVTFPSGAVRSLNPGSNLCMECHQGRSSTPTVDARIAAGNLDFANIHYYAAAATLFGTEVQGGYEYPGQTYNGRNQFAVHTALGVPELTTCSGCHMGSEANHTFAVPVTKCNDCHSGGDFPDLGSLHQTFPRSPALHFGQIEALKEQLLGILTESGVNRVLDGEGNHAFPYFTNIVTEKQLKAAYNWQVADKEPAGYIHNGIYIRQLLHDSITDMGGTPVVAR